MDLSIVIIGDEILQGQVTDTNSGAIALALEPIGWNVKRVVTVGDNAADIERAVRLSTSDSQLVITTGGLGPTKDDITKKVLAEIFGTGHMHVDNDVLDNVCRVFQRRGLQLNESTKSQAIVPDCCKVIQNQYGTAPIMWFELPNGCVTISMPGVPFETEGMIKAEVKRCISEHFSPEWQYRHHTVIATGLPESALSEHLAGFESSLPENLHLAYLPTPGYVRLRLDGKYDAHDGDAQSKFAQWTNELHEQLGQYMLYDGDATIAQVLLAQLKSNDLKMATAESCTGGNIAHSITLVPGSSEHFMGGIVSYANEVKANVLRVSNHDLLTFGAVSEQVVRQMAEGAMKVCLADCAIATSGIAGPGGGSAEKPVGTVWIAAACNGKATEARCFHFPGSRIRVIERATTEAMMMLIRILRK